MKWAICKRNQKEPCSNLSRKEEMGRDIKGALGSTGNPAQKIKCLKWHFRTHILLSVSSVLSCQKGIRLLKGLWWNRCCCCFQPADATQKNMWLVIDTEKKGRNNPQVDITCVIFFADKYTWTGFPISQARDSDKSKNTNAENVLYYILIKCKFSYQKYQ